MITIFILASDYTNSKTLKTSYKPIPLIATNYNYKNPFINFEKFFNNSQYNYVFFIKRNDSHRTLTNYLTSKNISYKNVDQLFQQQR